MNIFQVVSIYFYIFEYYNISLSLSIYIYIYIYFFFFVFSICLHNFYTFIYYFYICSYISIFFYFCIIYYLIILYYIIIVGNRHEMPDAWHLSQVSEIYKKGDHGDCGNYRPISLLTGAYKVFAMILLRRILDAGADQRIGSSQFGFRAGRSTDDALHCVRRAVERAWAHRGGNLHLLALDWRKAFDSIDPAALLNALRRFGLPPHFRQVVAAIYGNRSFMVKESGHVSTAEDAHSHHSCL